MAAHDVFRRAVGRSLSKFGEASSLDGTPCGSVFVARGVEMFAGMMDQPNDNSVVRVDLATIETTYLPKVDSVLVHPTEGRFRLMRLASDNGYTWRFVVAQIP